MTSLGLHAAERPVLELRCNGQGSDLENTGAEKSITATSYDAGNSAADLHSPDGDGVSEKPGDRAFDNRGATAMGFGRGENGVASEGGRIDLSDLETSLADAKSMTVTFWSKAGEQCLGANARLIDLAFNTKGKGAQEQGRGISLRATGDKTSGRFALEAYRNLDSGPERIYRSSETGAFKTTDDWIFTAIVFDGTASGGPNVTVYTGDRDATPAVMVAEGQGAGPLVVGSKASSAIANVPGANAAPFKGLIDNVRVYVSDTDNRAALDADQLEKIRTADLENRSPEL